MKEKIFKERIKGYDQALLVLLVIFSAGLLVRMFLLGFGAIDAGFSIWFYLVLEFPLLLVIFLMVNSWRQVKIGPKGIKLKWHFLRTERRKISGDEIDHWELVKETPLAAWSGWNVHYSKNGWKVYFFRNRGILLHLKSGQFVLVGLKDTEAAENALARWVE